MEPPETELRGLERSIRELQLPLDVTRDADAASVAHRYLSERGVPAEEQPEAVDSDVRLWESCGKPRPRLKELVQGLLRDCGGKPGEALAARFFDAHRLMVEQHELDFAEARRLLSTSQIVVHLMIHERMSCAQVANVLSASVRGARYNWKQVRSLARSMNLPIPAVTPDEVRGVVQRDQVDQVARFADSTAEIELQRLVDAAQALGFTGDASTTLKRLLEPDFDAAVMTLLHFLLTVCEFYDHPLSVLYEFSPRGDALAALQHENSRYVAKGSAALNIAKGAFALDEGWAWVRKGPRRSDALATVQLLEGMEAMHYAARRELAAWIRQLIVRLHDRYGTATKLLPIINSEDEAITLINLLISSPTRSYGTIEQRIVDALSTTLHPPTEWGSRGLRDSVFASNTSSKKMGDCEFTDRTRPSIVAYEARAGTLNDSYVDDHLRSLERVIETRREDLEAQHAAEDWGIRVTFVAHQFRVTGLPQLICIGEYSVELEMIGYDDLLERARSKLDAHSDATHRLVAAINDNLIGPLNEGYTPQHIRDRAIDRC